MLSVKLTVSGIFPLCFPFHAPDLVISIGLFIFAPASSFEALFFAFSLPFFGAKKHAKIYTRTRHFGFKIFCYVSCKRVLQGAVGGLRLSFFEGQNGL